MTATRDEGWTYTATWVDDACWDCGSNTETPIVYVTPVWREYTGSKNFDGSRDVDSKVGSLNPDVCTLHAYCNPSEDDVPLQLDIAAVEDSTNGLDRAITCKRGARMDTVGANRFKTIIVADPCEQTPKKLQSVTVMV